MDKTFSVYEHTISVARDLGSTVQQIGGVDRYEPNKSASPVGFGTRLNGMLHWCRVVEKLVAERDLRDAEVYVGFEKLSRLRHQVQARYKVIGATAARLVVFGAPDAEVKVTTAQVVPLLGGPLCEEWFLVVRSSGYSALIAARDLDGLKEGSWQKARRFVAVATHDPKIVDATAAALAVAVGK